MKDYDFEFDENRDHYVVRTALRGPDLLSDALLNKGTAFDRDEREAFNLRGYLPAATSTLKQQAERNYNSIARKGDPLEKYIGLAALHDRNEHLYYRVLFDYFEEFLPIVYTPTVGLACKEFSKVFRRGRGLWITPNHRGKIAEVLRNAPSSRVRLIVVTDNESILGIGDQGAGGMAISVGKLALYVAGAGIHPSATLPISLDVGTNNQSLLASDTYLGYREPRLTGEAYDSLVEEFVSAVGEVFPEAMIQWEDFRKENALNILSRFRKRVLSFNDDIQGTGAVALAGVMSGCRKLGQKLRDQRVVIFGAGAAGMGIAAQLRAAMGAEGLDAAGQQRAVALLDSRGLLVDDREIKDAYKRDLAWSAAIANSFGLGADAPRDLEAVIGAYKPTVLIGASGQPGAFTESLVRLMAEHCERPMIYPFSNPTDLCEAIPQMLINWTDGKALVATGSPFAPVDYEGKKICVGQGNNVFIFPALGLGALLSRASEITDNMITAAARTLAAQLTDAELEKGLLFPAISRLREVCAAQAVAVIRQAIKDGVAQEVTADKDIESCVKGAMWVPRYPKVVAG